MEMAWIKTHGTISGKQLCKGEVKVLMKRMTAIIIITSYILLFTGCTNPIDPPYQLGNHPINAKFGFTVQDGEWLYYMGRDNQISRTNGTVNETYDHTYGRGLNAYGDYIYFIPLAKGYGGNNGIYRVHKENPTQIDPLIQDAHIGTLMIINDHLYYSRSGGLYRADLDGQEEKRILKATINDFQFYEGWLYVAVADGGKVLQLSPDGKTVRELRTEDGLLVLTTIFMISDDWIYFRSRSDEINERYRGEGSPIKDDHIYRMKLDGSKLEYLTEGDTLALVGEGPYIYYMIRAQDEQRQLIRMHVDTGEKTVLYQGEQYFSWGNQIGDDIFFIHWGTDPGETSAIYQTTQNGEKLEVFIE